MPHPRVFPLHGYRNAFASHPDEEKLPATMQRAIAGLISAIPHIETRLAAEPSLRSRDLGGSPREVDTSS